MANVCDGADTCRDQVSKVRGIGHGLQHCLLPSCFVVSIPMTIVSLSLPNEVRYL